MAKATASPVGLRLLLLLLPLLGEGEFCRGLVPAAAGAKLEPHGGVDAFENAFLLAAGSRPRSYWPLGLHWEWGGVAGSTPRAPGWAGLGPERDTGWAPVPRARVAAALACLVAPGAAVASRGEPSGSCWRFGAGGGGRVR